MGKFVGDFIATVSRFPGANTLSNPYDYMGDDNDMKKLIKRMKSKKMVKHLPFHHFRIWEGQKVVHEFKGEG